MDCRFFKVIFHFVETRKTGTVYIIIEKIIMQVVQEDD
jgi:hypothetical protein